MVAVTSFIAVGALAAGAYSANEQSKAGKATAAAGREGAILQAVNSGKQAASLQFEAEEARRVSQVNAEKHLVSAREFRSSQRVAAVASGFIGDSGTAEVLQQETENLAQADALAMMFDGGREYVTKSVGAANLIETGASNAAQYAKEAENKGNAMRSQATQTLLGAAVNFAGSKYGQSLASRSTPSTVWGGFNGSTFSGNKGMGD